MTLPDIVSREDYLAARQHLLISEKEHTRRNDALSAARRRLPMVRVDKPYEFEGEHGPATLLDLFDGSRQLIVYHAMFDPAWDEACRGCSAKMDETSSPETLRRLKLRDTSFGWISRAPYPKLAAFGQARGWTFPWYSSYGSDFNHDFEVTLPDPTAPGGTSERSGLSCFLRDGDAVFHTYSTYARGTETGNDSYELLDLTALGRQEEWEEQPAGRMLQLNPSDPRF